jgi:hypothetical protein
MREVSATEATKLREFVAMVARLSASGDDFDLDGERCPNGFEHDTGDSLDALDSLIHKARKLVPECAPARPEFDWSGPEEGDTADTSVWIVNDVGDELHEVGVPDSDCDDVEFAKEVARRVVARLNAMTPRPSDAAVPDLVESMLVDIEAGMAAEAIANG